MDSDAYRAFADGPMLTRADMARCWALLPRRRGRRRPGPRAAGGADWDGLPPTRIAVAGQDPLRDDGARATRPAARGAASEVQERVFEDMVHGFVRWGGVVDAARELLVWLGPPARVSR